MRVVPVPSRSPAAELLDTPGAVLGDLGANLRDIRLLNRYFGGTIIAVHHVKTLTANRKNVSLLDVATGSADIPLALLRWGAKRGVRIEITGLDVSTDVLDEAHRYLGNNPIELVVGDARRLPFDRATFDIVTCCLALHHLDPDDACEVLAEMWRVARAGIIVVDLTRSYPSYVGTWLVTRLVARNRLTRHDGPLSVLRAYTPKEMRALAFRSGIENFEVQRHPLFRQALIARKDNVNAG